MVVGWTSLGCGLLGITPGPAGGDPRAGQRSPDSAAARAAHVEATRSFERALQLEQAGRAAPAIEAYEQLQRDHHDDPVAAAGLVRLARLRLDAGDVERATAAAAEALERPGPHRVLGHLVLAQAALRGEELRLCCEHAGRALLATGAEAHEGEAYSLAGECRWRLGELGAALAALSAAHERVDDPHRRAYLHGRAAEIALRRLDAAEAASLAARLDTPLAARYLALRSAMEAARRGDRAPLQQRLEQIGPWLQAEGQGGLLEELALRGPQRAAALPRVVVALLPLSGASRRLGSRVLDALLLSAGAFAGLAARPEPSDAGPPLGSAAGTSVATATSGLRLRVLDTRSLPLRGAQLVQTLARDPTVLAAIGPFDVQAARAAAAAATPVGLPLLPVTVAEGLGPEGGTVFRAFGSSSAEAERLATHAVAGLGISRLAILRPRLGYGEQLAAEFRAAVRSAGGEIVGEVDYALELEDPAGVVKRLARLPAFEALFVPDGPARVGLLAPHLAAQGLWATAYGQRPPSARGEKRRPVQLLGASAWYSGDLLRRAGRYLEGALVATPFAAEDPRPGVREWVAAFQGATGRSPTAVEAFAHDAFGLLAACVREEQLCDRRGLVERLRQPLEEPGVTTLRSFDAAGEPLEPPHLVAVRGGRFELVVP